MERMKWGGKK